MIELLFFTSQYPYGTSETFIENEIEHLSKAFDKVYVFPLTKVDGIRDTPSNVEVINIVPSYNRKEVFRKDFILFLKIIASDFFQGNLFNNEYKNTISRLLQLFSKSYQLERWLEQNDIENPFFYTYWFEDWATILSILKNKGIVNLFISRAHGFDIYEDRHFGNYIPFRRFQLKKINNLYCASRPSMEYMQKRYSKYSNKIKYSHLGVPRRGDNIIIDSEELLIVSCSNIIPLKRVCKISEALEYVNVKIKWIHFGDGEDSNMLKEYIKSLGSNISVSLKGRISNQELMRFYTEKSIDLFIHLSKTEGGVPVSIQEVVSFGIPVFATDAGGTKEIVNEQTGKLYPNNIDVKKLAFDIENFKSSKYSTEGFRKGVRAYWKENFDACENYNEFIYKVKNEK